MSRRVDGSEAAAAAAAASEAARVLQARQQEAKAESKQEAPKERETIHVRPKKVEQGPAMTRGSSEREAIMSEIRKSRGEQEEETKVEAPKAEPPKAETPKAQEVEKVETPKVEEVPKIEAPEVVKVKVDGEEFEVPKSEVDEAGGVSAYQRLRAADNRLKKANESLAESRRRESEILELVKRVQPPQQPAPQVTDQDVLAKVAAARFGSDEEFSAALQEIMARGRVDPNAITRQAVVAMEHNLAVRSFQTEFADVLKSPMAFRLAAALEQDMFQRTNQAMKQGQVVDLQHEYRTIGNTVRNAFGTSRPSQPQATAPAATTAQPTDTPSQVSEKEAKKASIVNLPTAAARAALPEEPKPETREEAMARMRASRRL